VGIGEDLAGQAEQQGHDRREVQFGLAAPLEAFARHEGDARAEVRGLVGGRRLVGEADSDAQGQPGHDRSHHQHGVTAGDPRARVRDSGRLRRRGVDDAGGRGAVDPGAVDDGGHGRGAAAGTAARERACTIVHGKGRRTVTTSKRRPIRPAKRRDDQCWT
jgi:hypothetical protein